MHVGVVVCKRRARARHCSQMLSTSYWGTASLSEPHPPNLPGWLLSSRGPCALASTMSGLLAVSPSDKGTPLCSARFNWDLSSGPHAGTASTLGPSPFPSPARQHVFIRFHPSTSTFFARALYKVKSHGCFSGGSSPKRKTDRWITMQSGDCGSKCVRYLRDTQDRQENG